MRQDSKPQWSLSFFKGFRAGQSLVQFRELGDPMFIGFSLHNLGVAARQQGDYIRAEALLKEAMAQFPLPTQSPLPGLGTDEVLASIGQLALEQGDTEAARSAYGLDDDMTSLGSAPAG